MTDTRSSALQYAKENRQRFFHELSQFVSIPSISTDPDRISEMLAAAEWVSGQLRDLGMDQVKIYPTDGHPIVYGEWLNVGPGTPTVLVYGHYDVQPAEPLELWESDPFTPTQRGESLYGRGASDMKGQVAATLKAIEAITQTGELPVNVKFLIEGEEEIGSINLPRFIESHKNLLACDFALNPDTGMIAADTPAITYALRGLAYFELRVYGPDHDLHSGQFGGTVHNPAQALCELIAGMHDDQGQVTLPGFYDKVRAVLAEERGELARLPTDESFYRKQTGAPELWGEPDYTPAERVGIRPTLEINGLLSGFTGVGAKTVLPAWAMAKISTRLVPDQDPDEVHQQLLHYLEKYAPETIRYEVVKIAGSPASISDRHSPYMAAMDQALQTVWGVRPFYRREGGSVPVVIQLQQILGVESVNCGFSLPDDNLHSPNEKLHLPSWYRGIDALIHFFYNLI
jgi:acetylornithine deacetylase/succinyl-diaminopimelate desuccinylase-like protein